MKICLIFFYRSVTLHRFHEFLFSGIEYYLRSILFLELFYKFILGSRDMFSWPLTIYNSLLVVSSIFKLINNKFDFFLINLVECWEIFLNLSSQSSACWATGDPWNFGGWNLRNFSSVLSVGSSILIAFFCDTYWQKFTNYCKNSNIFLFGPSCGLGCFPFLSVYLRGFRISSWFSSLAWWLAGELPWDDAIFEHKTWFKFMD